MSEWKTTLSTPWFAVEQQPKRDRAGRISDTPFYRFKQPDGVVMMPLTPEGHILLIRQYRQALNRETLEFPAGAIDPGESPIAAMARELFEETGYRCATIEQVLKGELRLDRETACNYFFVGQGAEPDPEVRPREPIMVESVTPTAFRRLVLDGRFDHIVALPIVLLASWKLGLEI
jgi:8-oxo-dGTP pyrophosphatase MutT (NUDIX family)